MEDFVDIPEDADTGNVHEIEKDHLQEITHGEGFERPLSATRRQVYDQIEVHVEPKHIQVVNGIPLRASVDSTQRRLQSADNCNARKANVTFEINRRKHTTPNTLVVLDKVKKLNMRLAGVPSNAKSNFIQPKLKMSAGFVLDIRPGASMPAS